MNLMRTGIMLPFVPTIQRMDLRSNAQRYVGAALLPRGWRDEAKLANLVIGSDDCQD
jgi:hypothetical protein